jgi:two-component system OmpR family sensor kinase
MRRRLILGAFSLLLVVIVGLSVPFGRAMSTRLTDELGNRVEREAFAVAAAVEDELERSQTVGLQNDVERLATQIGGRILLTNGAGVLLADSLQAPGPRPPSYATRPEILTALSGSPNWEVRHSSSLGYDILVSAVPIRSRGMVLGAVRVSYPMSEVAAAIRRSWMFLGAVGVVTLVIGLGLATWLARWAVRPLRSAAGVARQISDGDLQARVPEEGPEEVRELARDLNAMTDLLADRLRSDREFAANAAHQLRTPLSALRLSLEEALAVPDPRREIEHSVEQADRLAGTVDALLVLGKAHEQGREPVEVSLLARKIAQALSDGRPILRVTGSGTALADPERLEQVTTNLIENAHAYARDSVCVTVQSRGDRIILRVDDDGPGIPDDERPKVFDRFFRGRGGRLAGSGLGLAVAAELAASDGATISVSASDLGGACFEASYPAAPVSTGIR